MLTAYSEGEEEGKEEQQEGGGEGGGGGGGEVETLVYRTNRSYCIRNEERKVK